MSSIIGPNAEEQIAKTSVLLRYQYGRKHKELIDTLNPTDIALSVYREMLNDAGITFPLMILKLPIIRSAYTYTNPDKDIEAFVRKNLSLIWGHLIASTLTSFEYGFAAFEKRFVIENNKYWYKKFVDLYPDYISFGITNDGSLKEIIQKFAGRDEVTVPIWKGLVVTHNKQFGNHYGRSILRTAHRYWAIDKSSYNNHAIAQQDYALPPIIGRAPAGQTPVGTNPETNETIMKWNLDLIQEIAESLHSRTSVSFPSGEEWMLSLLSDKKTVHWDFINDHKFMDLMKAKAIFIPQELSSDGQQGGAYAKAKEHALWLSRMVEALESNIADEYFMPYLIAPLVTLNFYDGRTMPPLGKLKFEPLSDQDREFLQKFFTSVFTTEDYEVDFESLANLFNVPITKKKKIEDSDPSVIDRTIGGIQSKGAPSESDKKIIYNELRRTYNESIERTKKKLGFGGYIPMPTDDISTLEGAVKVIFERVKKYTSLPEADFLKLSKDIVYSERHIVKNVAEITAHKFIKKLEETANDKLQD